MIKWIDRIFLIALLMIILVLAGTAAAPLVGPMEGTILLLHMFASGALVFALPLFALFWVLRCINSNASGRVQRLGFWLLVVTGTITIATVFLCMLPLASTQQMKHLIEIHGYAGFAMVPALVLAIVGEVLYRRIQATRSATPG